ncbi:hypothetical protein BH09SUM1_BH09SUM1_18850 [soil metagenome]
MIDRDTAKQLLNFGARMGEGQHAEEQLDGAVALHNILERHSVAYLADEVGMGKTYVALGVIALFRHFDPSFRVMVIAPRENIQTKWMKDHRNFVDHNMRFADLRVKGLGNRPARPLVKCANLLSLVHESVIDPNRDFFVRLTSFSLPVSGRKDVDPQASKRLQNELRKSLPWMDERVFEMRNKQAFKDNFARAACCALPVFDLVIVDEAHNLKHGFSEHGSARNRVLSLVFGGRSPDADPKLFPNYGLKAKRVLFLSATPIEETYAHLWNQLDIFGLAGKFGRLVRGDVDEAEKKAVAAEFLLRRVTSIRVGGEEQTKNLYRREWRRGGVHCHDEPIRIVDDRQRLIVALVQKKVSELLGSERFKSSFQIGMLASFESFLETTRLKRSDETEAEEPANFDDSAQTDDDVEREGIDVADVNKLAKSYRERFGVEMPHPKMDAIVDSFSQAWEKGEKALVFVRRVASVKELKRKLDEKYDAWLLERLRRELPPAVQNRFEEAVEKYNAARRGTLPNEQPVKSTDETVAAESIDAGGTDTFFAWFFRGEGPRGFVSGGNIQRRFIQKGTSYATFFADNHVAAILGCRPGEVEATLARALNLEGPELRAKIQAGSVRFLSAGAKKHARADRFEAVQASAVEMLKEFPGPLQHAARIVWDERFVTSIQAHPAKEAPDIGQWLEQRTFFTELRRRPELRVRLWPHSKSPSAVERFREEELRGQLLATAARLGHAFIDLYIMTIQRLDSLDLRAQESGEDDSADGETERIDAYLDLVSEQMARARENRPWGAFDELADIADHFDLIIDSNAPDVRKEKLAETARTFGRLLRQQQPVGGMSGQVNGTVVKQFRMPGYPLVLVATDLLQEGEDLHTFCSAVHHYGISWTPSSMEQRIGRVDRLRSQTARRLNALNREMGGDDMLQVFFPHLEDTVEVLQVQRVLERMNNFLRLMHEGLTTGGDEEKRIDAGQEFVRGMRRPLQLKEKLKSAFPVRASDLEGEVRKLAVTPERAKKSEERFHALSNARLPSLNAKWEAADGNGVLLGTVILGARQQPFSLILQSLGERLLIRCISPVGRVSPHEVREDILRSDGRLQGRVGAIMTDEDRSYDLTIEDDMLLGEDEEHDAARIALLLRRVSQRADSVEQQLLPGRDEELDTFRKNLLEEGPRGR